MIQEYDTIGALVVYQRNAIVYAEFFYQDYLYILELGLDTDCLHLSAVKHINTLCMRRISR